MSGIRTLLPNKRPSENFDLEVAGLRHKATVSYFPSGGLSERFVSNHKAGNASDVAARDAGILVSLCLQHGAELAWHPPTSEQAKTHKPVPDDVDSLLAGPMQCAAFGQR